MLLLLFTIIHPDDEIHLFASKTTCRGNLTALNDEGRLERNACNVKGKKSNAVRMAVLLCRLIQKLLRYFSMLDACCLTDRFYRHLMHSLYPEDEPHTTTALLPMCAKISYFKTLKTFVTLVLYLFGLKLMQCCRSRSVVLLGQNHILILPIMQLVIQQIGC